MDHDVVGHKAIRADRNWFADHCRARLLLRGPQSFLLRVAQTQYSPITLPLSTRTGEYREVMFTSATCPRAATQSVFENVAEVPGLDLPARGPTWHDQSDEPREARFGEPPTASARNNAQNGLMGQVIISPPRRLSSWVRSSGFCRLRRRIFLSSSLSPPHTPASWFVSNAHSRHFLITGQCLHTAFASSICSNARPVVPIGKKSSGSSFTQAASSRQFLLTILPTWYARVAARRSGSGLGAGAAGGGVRPRAERAGPSSRQPGRGLGQLRSAVLGTVILVGRSLPDHISSGMAAAIPLWT